MPLAAAIEGSVQQDHEYRLKRIEMFNFKSYRGYHTIGPFKKFTCIIGPNGSGKSNLLDAISFVLGVRASHLRGTKLQDLIYQDGSGNPEKQASVKLVFKKKGEEEPISFSRVVNSNGISEYRVNDSAVQWNYFDQHLKSIGIDVSSRNFLVMQGDVESLAVTAPKKLTDILEKVAGTDSLKERLEELRIAKERAEEETVQAFHKKKNISQEEKEILVQREEAQIFTNLQKQHNKTLKEHLLVQLLHIQEQINHTRATSKKIKESIAEVQSSKANLQSQLQEKNKQYAKESERELKLERALPSIRKKTLSYHEQLTKLQGEIEHLQIKIRQETAQSDKLQAEKDIYTAKLAQLQTQLKDVYAAQKEWEIEMAKREKDQVFLLDEQLNEYHRKKEKVAKETIKEVQELDILTKAQELDSQKASDLKEKLTELEIRLVELNERNNQLSQRSQKVQDLIGKSVEQKTTLQQERIDIANARERTQARKEKLVLEIDNLQQKLGSIKAYISENDREKKFVEILTTLQRLFPAVRGRLSDLVQATQNRYRLAVTVALGKNGDSIVVDSQDTAIDCLQHMKDQRLGTASFIPLDSVLVKPVNEQLRLVDDSAKLVIDVLNYDPSIKKAVIYAVGNTMITETLEDAQRIAFNKQKRLKVVTIEGVVIYKSGLMAGGLSNSLEEKANRWDMKEYEKSKKLREEKIKELSELDRSLRTEEKQRQLDTQIQSLNSRIEYAKIDLDLTKRKLEEIARDITNIKRAKDTYISGFNKIEKEIEARAVKIHRFQQIIHQKEDEIFRDFVKKVGVQDIREYESSTVKNAQEKSEKMLYFTNLIGRLNNQILYEQSKDLNTPLVEKKKLIEKLSKDLNLLNDSKKKIKESFLNAEKEQQDGERKLSKIKSLTEELSTELRTIKTNIENITGKITKLELDFVTLDAKKELFQAKRRNIFETCEVHDIRLKEEDATDEDEEDSEMSDTSVSSGSQSSLESSDRRELYRQDNKRKIDFSKVPANKRRLNPAQFEEANTEYDEKLKSIAAQLDKIDPNLKALDRYKDVQERLAQTKKQYELSCKDSKGAKAEFNRIKAQRTEQFMKVFNHVSENIDKVYKSLTSGRTGNLEGGGTAYLSLENPDEPYAGGIKYNAMPFSKRFRDMDQLSGGEKTVAALALLFAINSCKPSPFFVLDEVDAALDKTNILKVASYVQSRSQNVQFIVISLQDRFYEHANSLVGVCVDHESVSSQTLTWDLSIYPEN